MRYLPRLKKAAVLILGIVLGCSAIFPVHGAEPTEIPSKPDAYHAPIQSNQIAGWPAGPQVEAESAAVMDLDSGAFLYCKNMDDAKYPASITKILTALLVIEHTSPDEKVCFSREAVFGIEPGSSHIGVREGEILTIEQCLYGILLESANEVCLGVAEHIGGSVESFVDLMNQKAASLGCTNTHFTNPNGLHDDNHYTTAHDMALIAAAAYKNPEFRKICQTSLYTIPPTNCTKEQRWLWHQHKMLPERPYTYTGCTGGKTGFTDQALNTLVTFAERGDRRLVCVSLRTNGKQIYADTASLLDYGFDNFQNCCLNDGNTSCNSRMLYPDLCFGSCFTLNEIRPSSTVTFPVEHQISELDTDYFCNKMFVGRNYLYHDHPVGHEFISHKDMDSLLTGPPELTKSSHHCKSDHASLVDTLLHPQRSSHCDKGMRPSVIFFTVSGIIVILLTALNIFLFVKRHPKKKP